MAIVAVPKAQKQGTNTLPERSKAYCSRALQKGGTNGYWKFFQQDGVGYGDHLLNAGPVRLDGTVAT